MIHLNNIINGIIIFESLSKKNSIRNSICYIYYINQRISKRRGKVIEKVEFQQRICDDHDNPHRKNFLLSFVAKMTIHICAVLFENHLELLNNSIRR